MAELVTLTTPITKPSQTTVHLQRLTIDVDAGSIYIQWLGNNGEAGSASYPTPAPVGTSQPTGAALLTTLNKLNLSAGNPSLVARVLTQLITDGYLAAGTISGSAS